MVEVVVPTNKLVEERGWRIDQVQDRKLVEVEEHRKFRLVPEPTGEVHIADKRCGIWLLRRHALHDSRPCRSDLACCSFSMDGRDQHAHVMMQRTRPHFWEAHHSHQRCSCFARWIVECQAFPSNGRFSRRRGLHERGRRR